MTQTTSEDWTIVANCGSLPEAHLYRDLLQSAGIPCHIQGENHRSMLGLVGSYIEINLMVPQTFEDDAIDILEDAASQLGENVLTEDDIPSDGA